MAKILAFPCPHCGGSITPPSAPMAAKPVQPVNTAAMTDAQLFAHYKKIAPAEDLRWFLSFQMSPALRARAEAVTKADKTTIASLRDAWRSERLHSSEPAIGTAEWHGLNGDPRMPVAA